jgi:hypothetical protein
MARVPIETLDGKTFRCRLGEDADPVFMGDRASTSLWQPTVELTRWDEECLSLMLEGVGAGDPTLSQDQLTRRDGSQEIRLYAPTAKDFEWELVLHSKPSVSEWVWRMKGHEGFSFYRQAPLTAEELTDGHQRPANVEGSYAVYRLGRDNVTGGTRYRQGKLFHLYRPLATDADGNQAWGDLAIDGDRLKVSFDPLWLDKVAVYPVVVDPNLGYTTVGGSFYNTTRRVYGCSNSALVTAGSNGTASKLWVYSHASGGGAEFKTALYDAATSGNRLTSSYTVSSPTTGQWNSADCSGDAVSIVTSTAYYPLTAFDDGGHGIAYDSGAAGDSPYKSSMNYGNEMKDPASASTTTALLVSVYLEYSAAAGFAGANRVIGGGVLV